MQRAAIISVILETPQASQVIFNSIVSEYHGIVRGRMGIPFKNGSIALISLTVVAELDTINSFIGLIGKLEDVSVKTSIAREGIDLE